MNQIKGDNLIIYNTLSRKKEKFTPLHPPLVGMYVCGPTVYNDVHLGNCRTFISFDLIYRYLLHLGYKVRYVRNITDAGHLEGDQDEGEDKFAKRAKLEQLEPMEIVQKYTISFHEVLSQFNLLPPSIEPTATGHIIEQIEMIQQIIEAGYAYEVNGSVYFDVKKYSKNHDYGVLTNRKIEDLLEGTRELSGQDEKKGRLDFALWIAAKPETLMQWSSPWGKGFPGWHIECSAMSTKYLGTTFDIHGGGMDLQATHHTNEIAQSKACNHEAPAKYWMHTNMLTVNGVRMSKSAGNGFLPQELFSGKHPLLERGYSPMTVRFFILQSHYRNTLDFSNEALKAAEKGYKRLMGSMSTLDKIEASDSSTVDIAALEENFYESMNDDFSSPVLIAHLFEAVRIINSCNDKSETINGEDLVRLKELMKIFIFEILGLVDETKNTSGSEVIEGLMNLILDIRKTSRENKNWSISDKIRDELKAVGVEIKDTKSGSEWRI